jgi:predicted enzyme related to lactoylglutathione lyase
MLRFLNCVVLAEDYGVVRDWWVAALGLRIHREWPELPYCDLAIGDTVVLGVSPMGAMELQPPTPRLNTTFPQFVSDDVEALLARIVEHGGSVVFGPSYAEDGGYWYGAFADIEGNQAWVVSPEAVGE